MLPQWVLPLGVLGALTVGSVERVVRKRLRQAHDRKLKRRKQDKAE